MTAICENRAGGCTDSSRKIYFPSLQRTLANRNYAKLWYGQAASTTGDAVFGTTLVLWVSQVLARGAPWAPAAVSGILVAAGGAIALVGPVAGVFVDRWDRKSTMMRTEVVRAVMVAGLTGLSFVPVRALPVWLWLSAVYLVVFVLNASGQFFNPARFATIGDVVHGEEERVRAAGLAEATTSAAGIIGPPIAALLLLTVGFQWALALNGISYLVSYLAIRFLRLAPEPARPAAAAGRGTSRRSEFSFGLRLFARNRFLVTLLTVTTICQCGTGAISALNVFFVTTDLHASSRLFGIAETAMGIGFIVGALAAGRMVRWLGARTLTWSGLLAAGLLAAAYAMQRSFPAGLVMLAVYAVPIAMLNTAVAPLLLDAAPREYLGRVMAVFMPVNQLASMASVVVSGWLTSTVLRTFRATVAGVTLNSVSLVFVVAGGLIIVSGIRAFAALPGTRPS
ncbi:MAG TPA: MFS transporter [Streptosporangiaceae bacterium]|nr:MFS transporter [Streptosporangiaceae bacterium]